MSMSKIHCHKVSELASFGVSANDIAKYLNIDKDSLIKDYSYELNRAAIDKTVEVANCLYQTAMAGSVSAMTFWLKNIGKWEEIVKQKEDVSEDQIFDAIKIELIDNNG